MCFAVVSSFCYILLWFSAYRAVNRYACLWGGRWAVVGAVRDSVPDGCVVKRGSAATCCQRRGETSHRSSIGFYKFYICFYRLYIGLYRFYIGFYMFYICCYKFYISVYRFYICVYMFYVGFYRFYTIWCVSYFRYFVGGASGVFWGRSWSVFLTVVDLFPGRMFGNKSLQLMFKALQGPEFFGHK